jgi:hypothetical protein
MAISAQQDAEIVEPSDYALQLDAVHQENRQRRLMFPNVIKESVLEALCSLGCHAFFPFLLGGGFFRTHIIEADDAMSNDGGYPFLSF